MEQREAVVLLMTLAKEHGPLAQSAPWQLDQAKLALPWDTPAGGWAALAELLPGAGLLDCQDQGFVPGKSAQLPEQLELALFESFTRALVPPQAAAAFGVCLQLHPIYFLELIGHLNQRRFTTHAVRGFLDAAQREVLRAVLTQAIELLLERLAQLGDVFAREDFDGLISDWARVARQLVIPKLKEADMHFGPAGGLSDYDGGFAESFWEKVLLPSQVILRWEEQGKARFTLRAELLQAAKVLV